MEDTSIKVTGYKCFQDEAGFERLKRMNIIIGRNNTGKSSLVDIIEIVSSKKYNLEPWSFRGNTRPLVIFSAEISQDVALRVFPQNLSGGVGITGNHGDYGRKLVGRKVTWSKSSANRDAANFISCEDEGLSPPLSNAGEYPTKLVNNMPIPLEGLRFCKIAAERNIRPELATSDALFINPDGIGLTNVVQSFINLSHLSHYLVKHDLLGQLNEIFQPNAAFIDILSRKHADDHWEIYLEEMEKGPIALSKSGSGLKTVILVLANLILVPVLEKRNLNKYVFAFEELENNLHPALLRKLVDFIYKKSVEHNFMCFLTTHSNVLIDQFSKQEDAQIIHVTQERSEARSTTIRTYVETNGILDDLDVRASDLLQANGIIWVEGPSDRIYLNRWINLWSDGKLKEGTHYQVLFYGGRLLSHLSAVSPEDVMEGISILRSNRNAIIIIDSDKRTARSPINASKRRIVEELNAKEMFCWITKGREIENYVPKEAVDAFLGTLGSVQVEPYNSFFEHLDAIKRGEGTKLARQKPLLAEKLVGHMSKENLKSLLDVDERVTALCKNIWKWQSTLHRMESYF